MASQCTASQRPTRMCSHVCIDHRKPYVYPRVLHRAVSTFSTRSCAHRHLRAQTTSQLPYSVCEARSLLELRREVAREGTEDRVAIALVVLVQCRLVRLHQCAANTSRRSRARHSRAGTKENHTTVHENIVSTILVDACVREHTFSPSPADRTASRARRSICSGRRGATAPRTARKLPRSPD